MNKLIYLACPYSHEDKNMVQKRFDAVTLMCASLFNKGYLIFSPITMCHPIAQYGLPGDFKFWKNYDTKMISVCDELWILTLDGWANSIGVQNEIKIAQELNKPVKYVDIEYIKNLEKNND